METTDLDLNDFCRICLTPATIELDYSIFDCVFNNLPFPLIINILTSVDITENDGLSSKICANCVTKVEELYSFHKMIISSDEDIRAVLKGKNHQIYEETAEESVDYILEESVVDTNQYHEKRKGRKHQCSICEKMFPSPSKLERHLKIHRKTINNTIKKYQCEICLKPFVSQTKVF